MRCYNYKSLRYYAWLDLIYLSRCLSKDPTHSDYWSNQLTLHIRRMGYKIT